MRANAVVRGFVFLYVQEFVHERSELEGLFLSEKKLQFPMQASYTYSEFQCPIGTKRPELLRAIDF